LSRPDMPAVASSYTTTKQYFLVMAERLCGIMEYMTRTMELPLMKALEKQWMAHVYAPIFAWRTWRTVTWRTVLNGRSHGPLLQFPDEIHDAILAFL
jgi:hypothetical protein